MVLGGIHAFMRSNEALQFVDTIVLGEAETVWPKIIADFEAGSLQGVYQGELPDLAHLPYPRRDLFSPRYMFASVQTSRGCPMDCEFCSVTSFNGRRYRRRPVDDVLDELETIPQKQIFFVDDNIIGYGQQSRDWALALFRGMVERRMNKWWFSQASINFADDEEVIDWAGKSGCRMIFLGLEAEDGDALAKMNKRLNLNRGVANYEQAFRRIQGAGIAVLGAFIFGIDGDTPEKLCRRAEYMMHSGVDVMDATLLTPLPGTRVFDHIQQEGASPHRFPERLGSLRYDRGAVSAQNHDGDRFVRDDGQVFPADVRLARVVAQGLADLPRYPKHGGDHVRLAVEHQLSQCFARPN